MSLNILYGNIKLLHLDSIASQKSICVKNLRDVEGEEREDIVNLLDDYRTLKDGGAIITKRSDVMASKVIQAIEPPLELEGKSSVISLQLVYSEVLSTILEETITSAAIPLIETQIAEISLKDNIEIALNALSEFSEEYPHISLFLVLPDEEAVNKYKEIVEEKGFEDKEVVKINKDGTFKEIVENKQKKNEGITEVNTEVRALEKEKISAPRPVVVEKVDNIPVVKEKKKPFMSRSTKLVLLLCILIVAAGKIFPMVRVVGDSMYPTLKNGNMLMTTRGVEEINRGDVVVFNLANHLDDEELAKKEMNHFMVKRVVGMPGDTIVSKDGLVYINGEREETPGKDILLKPIGILESEVTLKAGEYFVLGDNRINSLDSREFGPITVEDMKGKVKYKVFGFLLND